MEKRLRVRTGYSCDGKAYELMHELFTINIFQCLSLAEDDHILITDKAGSVIAKITAIAQNDDLAYIKVDAIDIAENV